MSVVIMGLRDPFQSKFGTWYYEIDRKRYSLKTKSKAEAVRLFNEIKRQYLAGRLSRLRDEVPSRTLGEFADEYRAVMPGAIASPSTLRSNLLALSKLEAAAGRSIRLDAVSPMHVDKLLSAHKGLSQHSLNTYVRTIRAVLNKAVEWGWLKANPLRGVKERRARRGIRPFLPPQEINGYLNSIEDWRVRLMAVAYCSSGMRRRELMGIRGCDVDMDNRRFKTSVGKTEKSLDWRPMNDGMAMIFRALSPLPAGTDLVFGFFDHPDTVSHKIKASLVAYGYPEVSLHGLRASFGVKYLHEGGDLRTLQDLLRHSEFRTTAEHYSEVMPDRLREEANRVSVGPINLTRGK